MNGRMIGKIVGFIFIVGLSGIVLYYSVSRG